MDGRWREMAISGVLIGTGGACGGPESPHSDDPETDGFVTLGADSRGEDEPSDDDDRLDVPSDTHGAGGDAPGLDECSAELAETELQPVFLGVAFDVSGSMGELDEPWHDPKLKWEPVVAATKAFFGDDASTGITATMTFFPAEDDRCEEGTYELPDVPPTNLPSTVFAEAIEAITPESPDQWRGGTPTLAVTRGTLGMLRDLASKDPGARYVYVLISDGYPQGCGDDNDIQRTVDVVDEASAEISTYVIGVQNPPGGPESVENLDAIAVAGGSEHAFILETGDPEQTAADFAAAIEAIRASTISCVLPIPESPNGLPLDPSALNVRYDGVLLGYDPECADPQGWRYDDPEAPAFIELCEGVCADVKLD